MFPLEIRGGVNQLSYWFLVVGRLFLGWMQNSFTLTACQMAWGFVMQIELAWAKAYKS